MTSALISLKDVSENKSDERPALISELAANPAPEALKTPLAASRGVLIGILLGLALWAVILALVVPHIIG